MAPEVQTLTDDEFACLLKVAGTCAIREPAPLIPAHHSARLIELGYMVDLEGRLRMTTEGRVRAYAGQLAD